MKHLINEDGYIITNAAVIELDDLSINIPRAYPLFTVQKCKIVCTQSCIVKELDENNNIILTDSLDVEANTAIHLLFESSDEKEQTLSFLVKFDDEEIIQFAINCSYVDASDRLCVLLNNYGIQVNDNWARCFRETDIHELNVDNVVKNQKMKEFLLEFFTLVGLRGTYKTLFAAVSYFGYSDLVKFEEHWISKNDGITRRYTEITSGFMERRLTEDGYTKIGDMTMIYSLDSLDPENPYTEDGLPNYVKVEMSFADLYFKLVLLRKILNQTFIPWDAYIVDIVGELHSLDGRAIVNWVCQDSFINQDEEQRYDFINVDFEGFHDGKVYLEEHKMIVSKMLYDIIDGDKIQLKNPAVAHITEPVIQIDKLDEVEIIDCKDFEIITRFQRKDVAIIYPKFSIKDDVIPSWVTGFIFEINSIVAGQKKCIYTSKVVDFETIQKLSKIGITSLGSYEVALIVRDQWGYEKKYNKFFEVSVESIKVDYFLLRPQYVQKNDEWLPRFEHFSGVQETQLSDSVPVLDATAYAKYKYLNEIPEDAEPVARHYTTQPSEKFTPLSLIQFSSVAITKLQHLPISEYWAPYTFIAIDMLKEGAILSLKTFQHNEYVSIEYKNELQFLHDCIEISKKDCAFQYFDFDIQPVIKSNSKRDPDTDELVDSDLRSRLDIDENDIATNMLCIYARDKGITFDKIIFRIEYNGDILTNDGYERGNLQFGEYTITLYKQPLTLFATNDEVLKILTDKIDTFSVFKNYVYPTFGCDAMIRFTSMYNITDGYFRKLVLYDKILYHYGNPIAKSSIKDWVDDHQITGVLDWYGKELYLGEDSRLTLYPGDFGDKMIMDYHFKIRVGDIWHISPKEYGVPYIVEENGEQVIKVDTFSFDDLERYLNKYHPKFENEFDIPDDMLENIDVYNAYDCFTIRSRNGKDIEVLQLNLGHHLSTQKIGAISKMFKTSSGEEFNIGAIAMAMPDENIKFENLDVSWVIKDHFSQSTVYECKGYFLKWQCMTVGVYDVEMLATDKVTNENISKTKQGCILVR